MSTRKLSRARLDALIEEAIIDAYTESEQRIGFYTMIGDNLVLPFTTQVLGQDVKVSKVDLNDAEEIVAVCMRGRARQAIPILDLPLPSPAPAGAEWIEAYRRWSRAGR
jgi:hypothetical protein